MGRKFRRTRADQGEGNHPFVSIPAFPNRKFRVSYIFVNGRAGIESPKDLEGKRVYVGGTAGIWARGALLNYYGVDFTKVHWLMAGASAKSWGQASKSKPCHGPQEAWT